MEISGKPGGVVSVSLATNFRREKPLLSGSDKNIRRECGAYYLRVFLSKALRSGKAPETPDSPPMPGVGMTTPIEFLASTSARSDRCAERRLGETRLETDRRLLP